MAPQVAGGRLLGDNTDEGLDARTSYHFLFGMFGSLFWWPIMSALITILSVIYSSELNSELGLEWMALIGDETWQQTVSVISLWTALILLFWLSGVSFAKGWDSISDSAKWFRRRKNNSKVSGKLVKLRELLK
jgi:hypothetical protein